MTWMGHKRIDETHRYVHVAEAHMRELPPPVRAAASGDDHPDRRIPRMLGARVQTPWLEDVSASGRGKGVAKEGENEEARENLPGLSVI